MGLISINGYEPSWLSYSTVDGYRTCGKRFELQKVLQLEQRPGVAALGGSAFHRAVEILALEQFKRQHLDTSNESDNGEVNTDA